MKQAKLMLIFEAVMKYGSMNAAAPHLGMTASAVSHFIKKLEDFYQVKLLNRTTRKLVLTEAGQTLLQSAQQLSALLAKTNADMQNLRAEPVGEVSLSMPTGYSQMPIMQNVIQQVRERFPAIVLILHESDKAIDLLNNESVDIAIRVMPQPDDENAVARALATWQTMICASPTYLAKHPIKQPQDLLTAHWLNANNRILLNTLASLNLPNALPESRTDCVHNSGTTRDLARLGLGLTLLMSGDVAEDLELGKLVQVLPDYPLIERTVYAMTLNRTQSAKIQAVLGVLAEEFKKN